MIILPAYVHSTDVERKESGHHTKHFTITHKEKGEMGEMSWYQMFMHAVQGF